MTDLRRSLAAVLFALLAGAAAADGLSYDELRLGVRVAETGDSGATAVGIG